MPTVHPLIEQLEQVANSKGIKRTHIARELGQSNAGVTRWFNGHSSITLKSLDKLAAFLGVEYSIVGKGTPAAHLLEDLTEALSERPIDADRVNGCLERARAFLSAGEAQ